MTADCWGSLSVTTLALVVGREWKATSRHGAGWEVGRFRGPAMGR